jgi:hypothetical protein
LENTAYPVENINLTAEFKMDTIKYFRPRNILNDWNGAPVEPFDELRAGYWNRL